VNPRFLNREQAGERLADKLAHYADRPGVIVLALPRGGVPVAGPVARKLGAPLDVFMVRKLGVPAHEELAMGAIASGDICYLNEPVIASLSIPPAVIKESIERAERELHRRETAYRTSPLPDLHGATIILIDDGLATGSTMRAAVMAGRERHPARIVVAVPVASAETCREFESLVDEVVCVSTPSGFEGVGQWYDDFSQMTDEEVRALLEESADLRPLAGDL
jgi:putative phosphoribosyl transferase